MTSSRDDLRYWYEMGYFYGRNDALDGRPYDARLPHEREYAALTDSASPRDGTGATRSTFEESADSGLA
jgi:hypothetical protein